MPPDLQPIADLMLLTIKAALAPVQAELSAVKQSAADMRSQLDALSLLRDRVTVVETKTSAPVADVVTPTPGPSLTEIELLLAKQVGPMTERMARLETTTPALAPAPVPPVITGPSVAELELMLTKQVGPLSERLARLEERAPVPGPAGKDGRDGANGANGADGLGFDDLDVAFDGDRTIEIKMARGDRSKSWPIVLPFLKQQGVFRDGASYALGDVVTWGGSQWHCNEATSTKPGEGSKDWTLIVKRGRDGKDGRDSIAMPGVPAVRT